MSVSHFKSHNLCQHFVLFGALGDLSLRKLFPALFNLYKTGEFPNLTILGVSRRSITQDEFAVTVSDALQTYLSITPEERPILQDFLAIIEHQTLDMSQPSDYEALAQKLSNITAPVCFYLATPPHLFGDICQQLHQVGLATDKARVVIEKPLGTDLASCQHINNTVGKHFNEEQVYRIDHYLGKETVQNILPLRFANPIFNSVWNREHIACVEINVAETVGIEGRFGYFDEAGQVRDMVQNHLIQLLCMVAMEQPARLNEKFIRDEKVKLLQTLEPYTLANIKQHLVLGQYTQGEIDQKPVPGYLEEDGANTQSTTETFMALKVNINNARWKDTPFVLRTGKRLAAKSTEIVVHFKPDAHQFWDAEQTPKAKNKLTIRIQPQESITLTMATKKIGLQFGMSLYQDNVRLDLTHMDNQPVIIPDAYQRLLGEVLLGNQSLFVRRDEVEASWQWCDQLRAMWTQANVPLMPYASGSEGPEEVQDLLARCLNTKN